jgi:hypothetical protein
VLVDDEGGEIVVLAAVFQAVLIVREDVDEIVAAVIAPGRRPLAFAAGVVVGILATATIAVFEIAWRVDDETGVAKAVTHGLRRRAHHFADRRHSRWSKFDVGQAHLFDESLRVDQSEPPPPPSWPGRPKAGSRPSTWMPGTSQDKPGHDALREVRLSQTAAGGCNAIFAGQEIAARQVMHRVAPL